MNGIISKDRVKEHGEVFTPDSIVNDMLDLVDEEIKNCTDEEYITKTYLEPACGDGQFLIRILSRKLEKVAKMPLENRRLALVKAVSSIYGVDIQSDNVINSRLRMKEIIKGNEVETFDLKNKTNVIKIDLGIELTPALDYTIDVILNNNIIHGDTLNPDGNSEMGTAPIIMNEYIFNGENLTINQCRFSTLDMTDKTLGPVNYLDIGSILSKDGYSDELVNEDGEADFDF